MVLLLNWSIEYMMLYLKHCGLDKHGIHSKLINGLLTMFQRPQSGCAPHWSMIYDSPDLSHPPAA